MNAMPSSPSGPRRRRVRQTLTRIGAIAGLATAALWGALELEMAHGNDPVLGPKARAAAERSKATTSKSAQSSESTPSSQSDYGYGYYGDYGQRGTGTGSSSAPLSSGSS